MKEVTVSEFRARSLAVLEGAGPEGVLITKLGRPVARLTRTSGHLIGVLKGQVRVDPKDNLFSTGIRWEAEDGIIDGKLPDGSHARP